MIGALALGLLLADECGKLGFAENLRAVGAAHVPRSGLCKQIHFVGVPMQAGRKL